MLTSQKYIVINTNYYARHKPVVQICMGQVQLHHRCCRDSCALFFRNDHRLCTVPSLLTPLYCMVHMNYTGVKYLHCFTSALNCFVFHCFGVLVRSYCERTELGLQQVKVVKAGLCMFIMWRPLPINTCKLEEGPPSDVRYD